MGAGHLGENRILAVDDIIIVIIILIYNILLHCKKFTMTDEQKTVLTDQIDCISSIWRLGIHKIVRIGLVYVSCFVQIK